jgi:hypothetical protein
LLPSRANLLEKFELVIIHLAVEGGLADGLCEDMRELRRSGGCQFEIADTAFFAEGLRTILLTTVGLMGMGTGVNLALRFGEVDEVGCGLLATERLGEGVLLGRFVVVLVGGEGDDVARGLWQLQLPVCEVEQVLLVLVSGELLEELGRVAALILAAWLGLGRVQVVKHLTIIFIT